MKLSTQQQAVVEAVAANVCDIEVTARAGCGKTTTILAACGPAKGRVGFVAFNKAIAKELGQKAPPHVKVQTLHALGAACLSAALGYRPELDPDKVYLLAKNRMGKDTKDLMSPLIKLVGLCKNNLTNPIDDNLADLAYSFDIDLPDEPAALFDYVREVLTDCIPVQGQSAVIDFDDMIWLPVVMRVKNVPQYDWLFVDEAQDLNRTQMELIRMVSKKGHICYVGDPAQAIYGFRGADSMAMTTLKESLREEGRMVAELQLTKTRRCPQKIVELAKKYVPDFEALPEAPEGMLSERTGENFQAGPGDMVLCRVNAPLVPIAYSFIRAGVPVKIQGRDIGAGLVSLVEKLKATNIDELGEKLAKYQEKELRKLALQYKDKPSKLATAEVALRDKVDTLALLAAEQNTIEELLGSIARIFGDMTNSGGVVLLSSIHKAKGLESDRVIWIIPPKPFYGEQEKNLQYVAITRAKRELIIHYQ
jgi:DNA helicase-2/ATP-dependent DNA helicase PcrA